MLPGRLMHDSFPADFVSLSGWGAVYHGGLYFLDQQGNWPDTTEGSNSRSEVWVMDRWDLLIIAGAAYVAMVALVRLMAARRDHLVQQVRDQIDRQRAQRGAPQPTTAPTTAPITPPITLPITLPITGTDSDRGAA